MLMLYCYTTMRRLPWFFRRRAIEKYAPPLPIELARDRFFLAGQAWVGRWHSCLIGFLEAGAIGVCRYVALAGLLLFLGEFRFDEGGKAFGSFFSWRCFFCFAIRLLSAEASTREEEQWTRGNGGVS